MTRRRDHTMPWATELSLPPASTPETKTSDSTVPQPTSAQASRGVMERQGTWTGAESRLDGGFSTLSAWIHAFRACRALYNPNTFFELVAGTCWLQVELSFGMLSISLFDSTIPSKYF